jgi:two-component system chemotaxis response regulator CheB
MIRILIVEDEPFIRLLIRSIIETDKHLTIVGEAEDGEQAVTMAEQLVPDIITMDLRLPKMNGMEATHQIMQKAPCPIIMVSAFTQAETTETLAALNKGAVDYVSKSTPALDHLDIGHIDTELIRKIHKWNSMPPRQREQQRRDNIAHLQAVQARLR